MGDIKMMKYIMINDRYMNEVPVMFPMTIEHVDIGMQVADTKEKIISAGFVLPITMAGKTTYRAFGESVSLDIKSRPEDSKIINMSWELG